MYGDNDCFYPKDALLKVTKTFGSYLASPIIGYINTCSYQASPIVGCTLLALFLGSPEYIRKNLLSASIPKRKLLAQFCALLFIPAWKGVAWLAAWLMRQKK